MDTLSLRRILATALSLLVLMASGGAHAAFRSYLSFNGNDANPCTLIAPCRLLPAALATTDPGGEVWMLDSANFNSAPVNITKSVTILAVPGALGSIVANNGDAIIVNTPGVSVTLRNLNLLHIANGGHGINFSQGARVIVEGCEIYGLPLNAIHATAPNSTVTVKETTIRQNGGNGLHLSGVNVTGNLVDSKVMHHGNIGVKVEDGARAFILDSLITNAANNGVSVGSADARLVMINSVVKNTTNAAIDVLGTAGNVFVTIARSTITHATPGINVNGAGNPIVVLDGNVLVNLSAGVNMNNSSAQVLTRNNNTNTLVNFQPVLNGAVTSIGGF